MHVIICTLTENIHHLYVQDRTSFKVMMLKPKKNKNKNNNNMHVIGKKKRYRAFTLRVMSFLSLTIQAHYREREAIVCIRFWR